MGFFNLTLEITVWNYGGHVGRRAQVHQHGAATFTLDI